MTDKPIQLQADFEAQVIAALMVQSNSLVPIKTAVKLCGISRKEIDRRVNAGTFPKPNKLSGEQKSIRKAFYLNDLQEWIRSPADYRLND